MESSAGLYARHMPYLDRTVQIGAIGTQLVGVEFSRAVPDDAEGDHPVLDTIERYLDGVEDQLHDIEVALTVDTDTRRVLETVRAIPHGSEVDLATLATRTPGVDPDDTDAVAAALAANPTPLVVPDHRIADERGATPPDIRRRLRALEGLD